MIVQKRYETPLIFDRKRAGTSIISDRYHPKTRAPMIVGAILKKYKKIKKKNTMTHMAGSTFLLRLFIDPPHFLDIAPS